MLYLSNPRKNFNPQGHYTMKKTLLFSALMSLSLSAMQLQAADIERKEINNSSPTLAPYQAKNFDYLLGKVKELDDALLKMHFKLYEGYVKNTNDVLQKIQNLNQQGQSKTPEFAGLKRILGWECDGMLLHEYYFENLGGSKPLDANNPLALKIVSDFGSYEQWKADFISTGLMRGIGWVVAYIEPKSGRLINQWINEHDLGHLAGGTPILVMDVFEHAYITQFALDRNKYIEVFFNNINWDTVSKRFKEK